MVIVLIGDNLAVLPVLDEQGLIIGFILMHLACPDLSIKISYFGGRQGV